MKILIGIDDSPYSAAAVEYVRSMTWPAGTQVIALSVARLPVMVYSEAYAPGLAYDEGMLEQEMKYHNELASRARRELATTGLTTEARAVSGDPRVELVEAARNENVDLLIVGSHGRTGIPRLLIGSVASHVVTHAPCSVLVVKTPGVAA